MKLKKASLFRYGNARAEMDLKREKEHFELNFFLLWPL